MVSQAALPVHILKESQDPPGARLSGKHSAMMLVWPLIAVTLLFGSLKLFQDKLLYFPSRVAIGHYVPSKLSVWPQNAAVVTSTATPSSQLPLANSQPELRGLIGIPDEGVPASGLAIVFHGNAGHAANRSFYAYHLTQLGIRTILAEYPGYGPRPGKPSEMVLIEDGVETVKTAYEQYGSPVWIIGESLGAGVAAAVVKEVPTLVQGIVLITPWNRLMDVAQFHYPYLPVRWLLDSSYDSVDALRDFTGPKLVIVAENDRVVPTKLGVELFKQLSQPKRLIQIDNAGHNDWVRYVEPDFWETSVSWLKEAD